MPDFESADLEITYGDGDGRIIKVSSKGDFESQVRKAFMCKTSEEAVKMIVDAHTSSLASIIGEDDEMYMGEKDPKADWFMKLGRNALRAEQRKRAGM